MRRTSKALILLAAAFLSSAVHSDACTNVLVTKGASTAGSNMVSYAADSHQLYGELYYAPAGVWNEGDMRKINEWDTGKFLGYIPQPSGTLLATHTIPLLSGPFPIRSTTHTSSVSAIENDSPLEE